MPHNYQPKRQRGIGLIEIIISVLVLSIGFLAAAKMQVQGMRFSQSAYYQSQAYFMASDMLDRMRANVKGVGSGAYSNLTTEAGLSDPGCAAQFASCTAAQIAQQDRYDWSRQLHPGAGVVAALPGTPVGKVELQAGTEGVFEVTLEWSEIINGEDKTETLSVIFATEQE